MKRIGVITILVVLWYVLQTGVVYGQEPPDEKNWTQLDDIDWSMLDESVKESGLPYNSFKEYLTAVLDGDEKFSVQDTMSLVAQNLFSELNESFRYILQMTALLIVAAMMKTMNVGSVGIYAVMVAFIWTTVQSFQIPYDVLETLIQRIQALGQAEMPVLAAIAIASGRFTTATLQGEMLLSGLNVLLYIMKIFFMPAIQVLFILYIIEALTGDEWSAGIASVLHMLTSKGMKVITTVLLILVSLRVQVTGLSDQWMRKAAKTVVSAVPVIGNSLSSALDTVTSSAGVLLKTVGILGILLMLLVCIMPICKIVILWLLYKVMTSMADPFIKNGPRKLVQGLSECISLMLGLMTCVMIAYIGVVVVFILTVNG